MESTDTINTDFANYHNGGQQNGVSHIQSIQTYLNSSMLIICPAMLLIVSEEREGGGSWQCQYG